MDIIEKKIRELDNKKKIILFIGINKESFILSKLLKEHFDNNLYCVLLNTIHIEEKDNCELLYQYYCSGIPLISVNCRDFFYRFYMINDKDSNKEKLLNYYNQIINNYKEYIKDEIDYFSFSFTKENNNLIQYFNIIDKISFEPFINISKKDFNNITQNIQNIFFNKEYNYWDFL